ncbi:hypothetical protein [Streptomyces sp. NBC_01353]|uniref:hypothetical protein n=1 Tax=Streptomyces sp. NBC_01353 TaxID=2903835 RepID=UPI002E32108B|nr:hypothetical protein [Streptomyces sp. NBC_01353]
MPAALLLATTPAQAAGTTKVVYTGDGGSVKGGKAVFAGSTDPERFQVCDTEADGMAARAYFSWSGSSHPELTLMDNNGATSFCVGGEFLAERQIPENTTVQITVCRVSAGWDQDCVVDWGRA